MKTTTAKKLVPRVTAKRLERPSASAGAAINLDDIPELTAEQLRGFKRRDPKEFYGKRTAKGFPKVPLEGLRKAKGVTQVALAEVTEMTQAEVSRLESRGTLEGVRVETLRRYVEGLGGHLELVARFPETGHMLGIGGAPTVAEEKERKRRR